MERFFVASNAEIIGTPCLGKKQMICERIKYWSFNAVAIFFFVVLPIFGLVTCSKMIWCMGDRKCIFNSGK